jgi:hypothetical protein
VTPDNPEEDIAALREAAEAGDTAATSRLRELHRAYEERARAALANDDVAAAPGLLRLAALVESALAPRAEPPASGVSVLAAPGISVLPPVAPEPRAPEVAESNVVVPDAPSPATVVPPGSAELEEARRLYAERSLVTPTGKNAAALAIAVLRKDPSNIEAARLLDSTIGDLERQVRLHLSEHRFDAASSLLSATRRAGIPVDTRSASHDRPPHVAAERWNALRVACLLIEADAMIQVERIVAPGEPSALSLLQEALRLDSTNAVAIDMAQKAAGHLLQSARRAEEAGRTQEASRLVNLAAYVRESAVERAR